MKYLAVLFVAAATSWAVPEQVQNKAFDPAKPPSLEESAPSLSHAKKEWDKESQALVPACEGEPLWVTKKIEVQATATKEKTVGVQGTFRRATAFLSTSKSGFEGKGLLDLSSWDSALPVRDYRIQKYVFGVENEGQSLVPFQWSLPHLTAGQSHYPLTLSFNFRGKAQILTVPVTVERKKEGMGIQSRGNSRFTFLTEPRLAAFLQMMSLCNHQFLASYVDFGFKAELTKKCP